ncbi:PEP-CTERM sorting domain-containing protein [Desulfobacula sp.]
MNEHVLMPKNIFQTLRVVCISALFLLAFSQPILAVPIVDGYLDLSEYSDYYYDYTLTVEGSGKHAPDITMDDDQANQAQLYYYQDTAANELYLALALPLSLVDNSYGDNSVGWESAADSGKNHNLKDLEKSDKLEGSYGDTNFTIEYYLDDNSDATATSLQWNYENYNVSDFFSGEEYSPKTFYNDGDDIDYTAIDDEYTTTDTAYNDWIFEVIYEFKLVGIDIDDFDITNFNIDVIHVSPNKIGGNKVYPGPPSPPTNPVPEPATMLLFGIGLLGIGVIGRKKHFQN